MKKFLALLSLTALTLVSCAEAELTSPEDTEFTPFIGNESLPESDTSDSSAPLNFTEQTGLWLPYVDFPDYMTGKSEEEFRENVTKLLDSAKSDNINTVYFHVHPHGDAYYSSEIYPRGYYLDGNYDPLAIVLEIAYSMGISVHAWINPLRMQTEEQMAELPDSYIVKKWVDEGKNCVKSVNGRWYLDPSYPEVTELISATAAEILNNYSVGGIHIDDYFYPTSDENFDRSEFEKSGSDDLGKWRRDNVSRFVKALYDTVKNRDKRLKFGISPQGNIDTDMNSQFADVVLWAGTPGYADYIAPQLYFGFKNAACPFEPTLRKWEELVKDSGVSLVIGLAEYKVGKADKWAGAAGQDEWITDSDIIPRQIELVKSSAADGYALYR